MKPETRKLLYGAVMQVGTWSTWWGFYHAGGQSNFSMSRGIVAFVLSTLFWSVLFVKFWGWTQPGGPIAHGPLFADYSRYVLIPYFVTSLIPGLLYVFG